MKEENQAELVQQEDVVQEQPVMIQPTIIPPRVLLELLVFGVHETGSDPKKSDAYNTAVTLQEQINKLRGKEKFMVRILWKTQELNENAEKEINDSKQWLIDTSSCKYYVFVMSGYTVPLPDNFIKERLKAIKQFEKSMSNLKQLQINFKKK